MADRRMHLGWFLNQGYGPGTWQSPWRGAQSARWLSGEQYIDLVRSLEAACIDFLMIEDTSYVDESYGGTREAYLRSGFTSPKLDPTVLAAKLAEHTTNLGIIATLSTTEWNPYLLARHVLSLDHSSKGRIGWNLVTGGSRQSAANFGMEVVAHDDRYERAHEFAKVVTGLWDSWEADALVADVETATFVDPTKVHEVNHQGQWFRSRGPLNVPRSLQGRPVICQAGASPAGLRMGGTWGDVVIGYTSGSVESYKTYRNSIRAEAEAAGRNPDDVKVLFLVTPYIGETEDEAKALFDRRKAWRHDNPTTALAQMSGFLGLDLSGIELDVPVGQFAETVDSNLVQSSVEMIFRGKGHLTLREIVASFLDDNAFIGTPETVADQWEQTMDQVGGDGFLIELNQQHMFDGRHISSVLDGLVPELQRRGLARASYDASSLRGNLGSF